MAQINPNMLVQFISCVLGCIGFALMFKIKGKQVVYSGLGALLTWSAYLVVYDQTENTFIATLVASMFVAAYANIMAKVNKAPATIFLSASVFPLIPGAHLYYMMYDIMTEETKQARVEARALVVICLAIAMGFIVVEIFNKYINIGIKALKKRA